MIGSLVVERDASALVIDDSLLTAWTIDDVLRDIGFSRVIVAATAAAAREAVRSQAPILIVCDLDLGIGSESGLELLSALDPQERVATLIYSGHDGADIDKAIAASRPLAARLTKPVSDAALTAALMRLLVGRRPADPETLRPDLPEPGRGPRVEGASNQEQP